MPYARFSLTLTERILDGIRVVNVCSVGNPQSSELRASYVLLTATESGYEIQYGRVPFSYEAVIQAVIRCMNPGGDYI